MIQDSGTRREFESGAVRDIQEGKGRCDLLPLDTISELLDNDKFLFWMNQYVIEENPSMLLKAASVILHSCPSISDEYTGILELSKHFEEGAKKYGERNWEKGLPVSCYIDSAIRHYLKFKRGDSDESHWRACLWNVVCAHWTLKHLAI